MQIFAGIHCAIVDLFSVKPIDANLLIEQARRVGGRVLTVEDHYPEGGLGCAVRFLFFSFLDRLWEFWIMASRIWNEVVCLIERTCLLCVSLNYTLSRFIAVRNLPNLFLKEKTSFFISLNLEFQLFCLVPKYVKLKKKNGKSNWLKSFLMTKHRLFIDVHKF